MRFLDAFASLLSAAALTQYAAADLRITADHFSFGGVNYPGLQTLNDGERNEVIEAIVKSGARVIRLFSVFSTIPFHNMWTLIVLSSSIWRLPRCTFPSRSGFGQF